MFKRIAAITFIFLCTSVAWMILGTTIFSRSYSSKAGLRGRVVSAWGAPQEQTPPSAFYDEPFTTTTETIVDGRKVVQNRQDTAVRNLPLESSRVRVNLALEHRQKGLLWYSTYKVAFGGVYTFRNTSEKEQLVTFRLPFPAKKAVYDDLQFLLDDQPLAVAYHDASASGATRLAPGKTAVLRVGYRSQGLDRWRYRLGGEIEQVRNFSLRMRTNFKDIDFPGDTLSPTEKRETPTAGTWPGTTRALCRACKSEWRCRKNYSRGRWRGASAILRQSPCSFSFS